MRILKSREKENIQLLVTKNLRSSNYIEEIVRKAEKQSSPRAVSFADEPRESINIINNRSDTKIEDTLVVKPTSNRMTKVSKTAVRRERVIIYSNPSIIGKEKLSKILNRINNLEKLVNLLLNQRIENVTI